jgi:hypothetical protein
MSRVSDIATMAAIVRDNSWHLLCYTGVRRLDAQAIKRATHAYTANKTFRGRDLGFNHRQDPGFGVSDFTPQPYKQCKIFQKNKLIFDKLFQI